MENGGTRIISFLAIVLSFLGSTRLNLCANYNQLNRIFHHQAGHEKKNKVSHDIELGKIVFYFSEQPRMEKVLQKQGKKGEVRIVFPATQLSAEAHHALASFNSRRHPWYSVKIESVKSEIPGIAFVIHYNAEHVDVDAPEFFDSIGLQKGIIFRIYNKDVLEKLGNYNKNILQTACLKKKPGIVIDCGHGGDDAGAKGLFGLEEKEITLQLGLQVAKLLRNQGFEVFLTRDADVSVALDSRTSFANNCPNAAIFVSIHANSASSKKSCGIETFCLDPQLFRKDAHSLASAYKKTVNHIIQNRCDDGCTLARAIHSNIASSVKDGQYPFVDRNVKRAVSQVLVGTNMPSALVEVGFLSNEHETMLLKTTSYQQRLAYGICKGIVSYAQRIVN